MVEFLKQDLEEKFPIKGKTKTDVVTFSVANGNATPNNISVPANADFDRFLIRLNFLLREPQRGHRAARGRTGL